MHCEGSFEGEGGAVAVAETRQGNAKIKVAERQKMLQADGEKSLFSGIFVAALPQSDDGQSEMRFGAVTIDLKRTLKSVFGIVGALLSQVGFPDPQVQVGEM
jgi:hypothetical protein